MFVKICGLTTLEDTLAAAGAGAQAVGFNFVRSSPRYLDPAELSEWIGQVPAHIWKVGIFADQSAEYVASLCERLSLDVAQLHGDETPAQVPRGLRVWKAARVKIGFVPPFFDSSLTEAMLLDGPAPGIPFDWSTIQANGRKLILAGGLNPANVREAIELVRPWGVDVSSRIEIFPGRKDHRLMAQFIENALSC